MTKTGENTEKILLALKEKITCQHLTGTVILHVKEGQIKRAETTWKETYSAYDLMASQK